MSDDPKLSISDAGAHGSMTDASRVPGMQSISKGYYSGLVIKNYVQRIARGFGFGRTSSGTGPAEAIPGIAFEALLEQAWFLSHLDQTPTLTGVLAADLHPGPLNVTDNANTLSIALVSGSLSTITMLEMLNGGNLCAVKNSSNQWELLQFLNAELISGTTYDCTVLLRGRGGTGGAMDDPVSAGAEVKVF